MNIKHTLIGLLVFLTAPVWIGVFLIGVLLLIAESLGSFVINKLMKSK